MPRKFIYGPGLPGYGTAGTDGSTGLAGLAVFFSAYDGNSDTVTIKGKIIANKELFSNNVLIPGYPTRTYQTGDIFIDKNARVFQIDFAEGNLYKDTGIFLNTSGFFSEGPLQIASPGFQRYSNAFETEKFLIDVVYTNTVGDYTQYPLSIYGNPATYFGKVSYIGNDVVGDLNGWYPFEIWTIGNNTLGKDAIALARRENQNEWHFGNWDGSIRDVSLYLDFNDIYCPSIASKTTENLILYWDTVTGRIAYGDSMIMSNYGENRIITAGSDSTDIYAESNLTFDGNSLSIIGDLFINKTDSSIVFGGSGTHRIYTNNISSLEIYTGNASSGGYSSGNIKLYTGRGPDYTAGISSGDVSIFTGNGGDGSASTGGTGGIIQIRAGNAGDCTGAVVADGAKGGSISINAGTGGNAGSSGSTITGKGGDVSIGAGNGYDNAFRYEGGSGGSLYLSAGRGGDGNNSDGAPGNLYLIPGSSATGSWTAGAGIVYVATVIGGDQRGRAAFATGSAAYPSIAFASALSTGFFRPGTNQMGISIAGSENFRFDVSTFHAKGNIVSYSSTLSDIRLKKNIEDIQDSLDKVLKLRGISYERKSNDEKHIGYIAQEFEEVFPELILETNILGEEEDMLFKTIRYTELIPYLSGAIKEQQELIDNQQKQINYLMLEIELIKNKK
jgi:hypothetical protein